MFHDRLLPLLDDPSHNEYKSMVRQLLRSRNVIAESIHCIKLTILAQALLYCHLVN